MRSTAELVTKTNRTPVELADEKARLNGLIDTAPDLAAIRTLHRTMKLWFAAYVTADDPFND